MSVLKDFVPLMYDYVVISRRCVREMDTMDYYPYQKSPLITEHVVEGANINQDLSSQTEPSWFRKHASGWKFVVFACSLCSIAVFVANLAIFMWAGYSHAWQFGGDNGRFALYDGNCKTTQKLNVAIHLLINLLGTILLSASNYCMQCLSAPTREEVDRAHGRGMWMDIGIQSFRNLKAIGSKRSVLYFVLGFSSLPLHLL